jgi:hypothetical protein
MEVDWYKCQGNIWCELNKIDADHKYLKGVDGLMIIWSGKEKSILKVSKGKISNMIKENKADIAIQAFAHLGLFVTWTDDVPMLKKASVYNFLVNKLNPKFMEVEAGKSQTEINLPW